MNRPELHELAAQVGRLHEQTLAGVAEVVVGMNDVVTQMLTSMLAGGHVLLEGVPGTGEDYSLPNVFSRAGNQLPTDSIHARLVTV